MEEDDEGRFERERREEKGSGLERIGNEGEKMKKRGSMVIGEINIVEEDLKGEGFKLSRKLKVEMERLDIKKLIDNERIEKGFLKEELKEGEEEGRVIGKKNWGDEGKSGEGRMVLENGEIEDIEKKEGKREEGKYLGNRSSEIGKIGNIVDEELGLINKIVDFGEKMVLNSKGFKDGN